MLHLVIERTLPTVISLCELMGIFVVAVSALGGFFRYCRGLITHRAVNIKADLANGLAPAWSSRWPPRSSKPCWSGT